MQILEDEHIVEPGQTFMFIRIHMFTVEEEQFDLIHDLPEALGFANTTGIQTDVVAPAYGRVEQPQQKRSRRCGLAAAKGHAAAGIVIKQAVAVHDAHDFFHGHAFSGHFPRLGGAAFHAEAAIRADRTIPVVNIAGLDHGTVRANPFASAAPHA